MAMGIQLWKSTINVSIAVFQLYGLKQVLLDNMLVT